MSLPLWHLTTNPNWKLDLAYHPSWAYWGTGGPHHRPALFVTDNPRYWQPFMGLGPIYAVRIEAPEEVLKSPGRPGWVWPHPESLIEDLDKVRVVEMLPLEEAISRGQAEERARIPWDEQQYGGFETIEDWWYRVDEIWDDEKMETFLKFTPRKGLSRLMKEWRKENPGYKNPRDKDRKEERKWERERKRERQLR